MKKCSRCGTEILTGQLVCPHCGKPQRGPREVRCRHCGTTSSQSLRVCPACGEPLQHDWLRTILIGSVIVVGIVLGLIAGPWLFRAVHSFHPEEAISTVQAVVTRVPTVMLKVVDVPSLTPSLTPSITPTPTNTPTTTPTPSMTPTPTLTPTPTPTRTPTPTSTPTETPTRAYPTWTPTPKTTPTATPTPAPTVAPPTLLEPEDGAPYEGVKAIIKLGWRSSYTLKRDECYLITLRWTEGGAPASNQTCVQDTSWFVPESLYLRADQETERIYFWRVQVARQGTDSTGQVTYVPLGPASEERSFYWK